MHPRRLTIAHDHPAFAGHFPGHPLLPGVALLAEVIEAALDVAPLAARLGAAPRLSVVKFLAPVGPGAELEITFDTTGARTRFEVRTAGPGSRAALLVASGEFDAAPPDAPADVVSVAAAR